VSDTQDQENMVGVVVGDHSRKSEIWTSNYTLHGWKGGNGVRSLLSDMKNNGQLHIHAVPFSVAGGDI